MKSHSCNRKQLAEYRRIYVDNINLPAKKRHHRVCPVCLSEFKRWNMQKYCSRQCAEHSNKTSRKIAHVVSAKKNIQRIARALAKSDNNQDTVHAITELLNLLKL